MLHLFAALPAFAILLCATPLFAQNGDAVVPISPALCNQMKLRHVLNRGAQVGCDRLRLLTFGYVAFDGQPKSDGEMVVMDAVADHVLRVFVALRARGFPIASVKLMDHFNGDDDASMAQNNTSAFNVRPVAGTGSISLHAYGVAVELHSLQKPFIPRPWRKRKVAPPACPV